MTRTTPPADDPRTALLHDIADHLDQHGVDAVVAGAVDALVRDVAVHRADRMLVAPHDPAVVVERLAAWALRRAGDRAVRRAAHALRGDLVPVDQMGSSPMSSRRWSPSHAMRSAAS